MMVSTACACFGLFANPCRIKDCDVGDTFFPAICTAASSCIFSSSGKLTSFMRKWYHTSLCRLYSLRDASLKPSGYDAESGGSDNHKEADGDAAGNVVFSAIK